MDLREALTLQPKRGSKLCKLARIQRELGDADAATLSDVLALSGRDFPAHRIAAGLQLLRYEISDTQVRNHRGGRCCCFD